MDDNTRKEFDIAIVGGGQVGLLTALSVARYLPHFSICLIEAKGFAQSQDPRSTALAPGAVNMLRQLDCWTSVQKSAAMISAMKVSDSDLKDHVRPILLALEPAPKHGPIGYIVPNQKLNAIFSDTLKSSRICLIEHTKVTHIDAEAGKLSLLGSDGHGYELRAKLICAADGAKSLLRQWAGIKTYQYDYDQRGLVATIWHERDHKGVAFQHFLPDGPFACLPLSSHHSSIVWSVSNKGAENLLSADENTQNRALNQAMGTYLGTARLETTLMSFPLNLVLAAQYHTGKLLLLGDAAHKIHPLAGQGLNMGFADVAAFADALVRTVKLGLPLNDATMFAQYVRARRFDTLRKAATTDLLNRLFSNNAMPLKILRDTGMGIVNHLEGLKAQIISQASGTGVKEPSLMRGLEPGELD